jgi:hypothetical protein
MKVSPNFHQPRPVLGTSRHRVTSSARDSLESEESLRSDNPQGRPQFQTGPVLLAPCVFLVGPIRGQATLPVKRKSRRFGVTSYRPLLD